MLDPASEGRVLDIALTPTRLFVRSETALDVYDRSVPLAPELLGSYTDLVSKPNLAGWKKARIAATADDRVLLTDQSPSANFKILNVADPTQITPIFQDAFPAGPSTVVVVDDFVYITTREQLIVRTLCE